MPKPRTMKYLLSAALAVLFLCGQGSTARAEAPEDQLEKGIVPACSTQLDTNAGADAERYENVPVDLDVVAIGLRYGKNAVSYAEFFCNAGTGFQIGSYDAERRFHEHTRTGANWLEAYRSEDKIVLSGWNYYEEFDAAQGVAIHPCSGTTAFRGDSYRGGIRLTPWEDDTLIVTNFVGLEDYVKGVIPYEMSSFWPYEALRAQAVCARTYVVYNHFHPDKYVEYDFDLTGDTESQVYRGVAYATEYTDQAVESTEGQYVRYRGEVCEIYYFASDGGKTEDGKNVFGSDRPYLAGKTDPFEDAVDYTGRSWTAYRDGWELSSRLHLNEVELGVVAEFEPVYSELGNVIAVRYLDENGESVVLTGRDSYAFVGLSSCRFHVQKEENVFVFTGSGWGHSCGMSQWGARAMAEVYGYSCEDIIRFYYTGAYVG
ncbi:MAG: SpoIID/LytB domain-containing protein [Oscillospiraceae bacterium]|nr:SpoIID/LytB domain-containing protein [Oscillospiraceae bacterium]